MTTRSSPGGDPAALPEPPTSAGPLLILAMDHRDSLRRDLYGLARSPSPVEAARIAVDKLLVYQGLLDALPDLPESAQPGVLVDEEYGAGVAELAGTGPVALAMPIEASGQDWFTPAYGPDWAAHVAFFAPEYAKVLVRDNPGLPPAKRAEQARRLAEVCATLRGATDGRPDRPLILELLVPAGDGDLARVGGDRGRYDRELRPDLTVTVMRELQDAGVEPAIWKVEGLETRDAAEQIVAAARRGGRGADCIVLGRHADQPTLDRWLSTAAPVDGFVGFAVGRSIWWDALLARLHGGLSEEQARAQVREAYLHNVRTYVHAAESARPVQAGSAPADRSAR